MEIGLYSSRNWVGVQPFGIGIKLAILHYSGKLPQVKRARSILANLRETKSAVFKNKGNILSESEPPIESNYFK